MYHRRQILLCCVCVIDDSNIITIARSSCCTRYSNNNNIISMRSVRHQLLLSLRISLLRLIIVVAMLYWQQTSSEDRTHTVYTTIIYYNMMLPVLLRRENTSRTFHYCCRNYYYRYNSKYIFYFHTHTRSDISTSPDDEPRARRRSAWELSYARGPVHARRLLYYIIWSVLYSIVCCLSYNIHILSYYMNIGSSGGLGVAEVEPKPLRSRLEFLSKRRKYPLLRYDVSIIQIHDGGTVRLLHALSKYNNNIIIGSVFQPVVLGKLI